MTRRAIFVCLLAATACADSTGTDGSTDPRLPRESSARLVVALDPIAPPPAGAQLRVEPFVVRFGDGVVQRPAGWTRAMPAAGVPLILPIDLRACLDDPYWRSIGLRPVCEAGVTLRYLIGGRVRDEVQVSAVNVGVGDAPAVPESVRLSTAPRITFVDGIGSSIVVPAEGVVIERPRPGAQSVREVAVLVRDSATGELLDRRVTWTQLDRGLVAPATPVFERFVRLEPGVVLGTFRLQATIGQATAVLPVRVAPRQLTASIRIEGPGAGRITASTGPICEHQFRDTLTRCALIFDEGTRVVLTAAATTGSLFDGWQFGCDAVSGLTCVLPASPFEVAVRFVPERAVTRLTLVGPGTASGTVLGSNGERCSIAVGEPSRICTFTRPWRDTLVLTPAADPGSRFEGFTGACDGAFFGRPQPTCVLLPGVEGMATSRIVPDVTPVTLAPASGTTATARLVSTDGRLDCTVAPTGATGRCNADYRAADTVALDVVSPDGVIAASWDGTCIATSTTTCFIPVGTRAAIRSRLVPSQELTLVLTPGNGGRFGVDFLEGTALEPPPPLCRATSVLTTAVTCTYRLPRGSTYVIGVRSAIIPTRVLFDGPCGPRSSLSTCEVRVDRDITVRVGWQNQP